jgi:hypothetical protein
MRLSDLQKRVLAKPPEKLLLDAFPNASAAYSLRKLRTAYTGNCIEVRRSSDNALQNIGFVNNELDTVSLLAFVGAGDGFVRTWYDQSGQGRNALQNTNSRQPQIVNNGSLLIFNNKPHLFFDGTNHAFNFSTLFNNVGYASIFSVIRQSSDINLRAYLLILTSNLNARIICSSGGVNVGLRTGGRRLASDSFQSVGTLSWSSNEHLHSSFFKFSNAFLENFVNKIDNGSRVFQSSGTTDSNLLNGTLGAQGNGTTTYTDNWNGTIKEIILYETDQSANKTPIENNINSYYNIF